MELESEEYLRKVDEMFQRDVSRMENTKKKAQENRILADACFTSVNWPIKITFPLFETKAPYAVPTNYFQPFFVDGKKQFVKWAHDCTRSIGFYKGNLIILSKLVNSKMGEEYFGHYVLLMLGKGEFKVQEPSPGAFSISGNVDKLVQNLATGEQATKNFKFNFTHKPTEHASVSKEHAASSGKMKEIYARDSQGRRTGGKGSGLARMSKSKFEEFVITVPHFAPHPYLLLEYKKFGFGSRFDFVCGAIDYVKEKAGVK